MQRFKNILYFADGALEHCAALQRAAELADSNQARLTLMDVLPPAESSPTVASRLGGDLNQVLRAHRQLQLEDLANRITDGDGLTYTKLVTGTPFIEVIRTVIAGGHDLVVKAASPPGGISERLFGSTDLHLMRKCPCPVWVDQPASSKPYGCILAAVDPANPAGAGVDRMVMELASSLARRESTSLHVVHAWRLYGESMLRSGRARVSDAEVERLLDETRGRHRGCLDALLRDFGLDSGQPQVHLVQGQAAQSILGVAKRTSADLIVIGTLGRSGIPGLFIGNTAEDVLQDTRSSILAVKPKGFVSPVQEQ